MNLVRSSHTDVPGYEMSSSLCNFNCGPRVLRRVPRPTLCLGRYDFR